MQDGELLIRYGERGEELYLIRYGEVCVMRPDGNGGQVTAVVLKRGQFVGERAVINNTLRSADCVAKGDVQVRKRAPGWIEEYREESTCTACLLVYLWMRVGEVGT